MEEIASTDNIQKEILDDARKKAEYLLRQADAEVSRIAAEGEAEARHASEAIVAAGTSRAQREREELLARVPLEKGRYRTQSVDRALRGALERFMGGLGQERVVALSARLLRNAAPLLAGKDVTLRYRGLAPESAAGAFAESVPRAGRCSLLEDDGLCAAGMVVEASGGDLVVRATMDLVEEELADRHRGELAEALYGRAAP
ncbi:MAG: V-type ATP synthase subunit E [Treponema sp.]|nr:V-type ATP synthase subunit E [Treponema sp.]